jgi:hypothetical protein
MGKPVVQLCRLKYKESEMAEAKVKEKISAVRFENGILFLGERWENDLALAEHVKVYHPGKELIIKDANAEAFYNPSWDALLNEEKQ